MAIDNFERFFEACNPSKTIDMGNPADRPYYIDFSTVRGGKMIEALNRTITRLSPDTPTCQLFTGHIGCGKSTDLLRLKAELSERGFHVVYFESTQDLDMGDVDISDILLAIARQVSASLEQQKIHLQPRGFKALLKEAAELVKSTEVTAEASFPGLGNLTVTNQGNAEFSLAAGIGKITAKTKDSARLRSRLRQYLEPQTNSLLQAINEELLKPAIENLKQQGKRGLVVIVDNLDRVDARLKIAKRSLPEYLFIDRGEQLRRLNCHVVYTIPLSLMFSNESETLKNRLGGGIPPQVLPMVSVQRRDGRDYEPGIALLRQMVLARAFPEVDANQRLHSITDLFDSPATLDRLCRVSGGHVRNLLGLLYGCLREQDPPLSRHLLEKMIRQDRDRLLLPIDNNEWELLFQVIQQQNVSEEQEYQTLWRTLWLFEYRDEQGCWFGINPVLAESEKFKSWQECNH
ncbi:MULTISPECIES: P-loop NTPase fold protein [unclassified Coleofasciculus]|uniref:P-loop NTPase fold protein n=1 Tax=unclassified Coleofasciculus TaxID=2692782 RepID=UPI0018816905|nr:MULTISPECIES: P-loop NTPase fold protein [unclassified Coleofasciculus]MBE9125928.1 AAA family ATPase [Coleofasciculus sp. LEGE 07081]MBE9149299.1 AAA family ATPase [Coleofasciculus sp. LEGE 07092]